MHASDVPPLGYKIYEIRAGAGASFEPFAVANAGVVETDRYRVEVAPRGALTSWRDKTMGDREFVRTVGDRAINDLGAATGSVTVEHLAPCIRCAAG